MAPNFILAAAAALLIYSGWKGASLKNTLTGGEADQGGPDLSQSSQSQAAGGASMGGVESPAGESGGGVAPAGNAGPNAGGVLPPDPRKIRLPKTLSKSAQELVNAEAVVRKDFPHWPRTAVRVRAQLLLKARREGRG